MSDIKLPGIYQNVPIEEYHFEQGFISASSLKTAKQSLRLFQMYRDGKLEKETKLHFDFGNAFELALLDRDEFNKKVANEADIYKKILDEKPDTKSFRGTNMYKEWDDEQKRLNKYVIPATGSQSFETIATMLESCLSDAVINRLIKNIEYQYSIYWQDKETGLNLKTRPDICKSKKNIIVDVKTTIDGSPQKFSKDLANYDYPLQACMQIDGVIQSGFMPQVDNYFWLIVEKEPPYSATLYEFAKEDIAWCTDEYKYIKGLVSKAINENKFPSYSQRADNKFGILTATIPLWYRSQLL